MGFLEKMGLVEKVTEDTPSVDLSAYEEETEQYNPVETVAYTDTLVTPDDVYKTANYEVENSIFKVQEYKNSLPQNMATEMQKSTILGILKPLHLDVSALIEDGEKRIEIIRQNIEALKNEANDYINVLTKEIADLNAQIEKNKEDINAKNVFVSDQTKVFEEEIENIKSIIEFIS